MPLGARISELLAIRGVRLGLGSLAIRGVRLGLGSLAMRGVRLGLGALASRPTAFSRSQYIALILFLM
jgi:hypothetical protein